MRAGGSVAAYGAGVVVDGDGRPRRSGQNCDLASSEEFPPRAVECAGVDVSELETPFFNPPSAPSAPPNLVAKAESRCERRRATPRSARGATPGKIGKAKIGARRRASNCDVANAEVRRSQSGSLALQRRLTFQRKRLEVGARGQVAPVRTRVRRSATPVSWAAIFHPAVTPPGNKCRRIRILCDGHHTAIVGAAASMTHGR